jgi:hypothetical protein
VQKTLKNCDKNLDELVQTKELEPLLIENAKYGPVESEPVNYYLTHGNIIRIGVLVHYHNDLPVELNYVHDYNYQNDIFSKGPINVCILEVYNPRSRSYSPL